MSKIKKGLIITAFLALVFPCLTFANTRTVQKVLAGDVVQIGDSFVARLTGISAPPKNTVMGYKIYDFTKRQLEGKVVKLFTWTRDNTAAGIVHDEEGRAFVQIEYGKGFATSINELLLKKGFARVDREHLPDFLTHYLDLEREAREKGLGIWRKDDQGDEEGR